MGAGRAAPPAHDADLNTALELVILEWRPASHRDIDDLPEQAFIDHLAILEGRAATREPWAWYRTGPVGIARLAHQFRVGPDGPEELARCGEEREAGAEYRRDDDAVRCQRCRALADGRPLNTGTIGDLDVHGKGG